MTLDNRNLNKLNEFKKQVDQSYAKPDVSAKESKSFKTKLHPIEIEEDPKKLFKELINASPNGEIPDHLIKRLRQLEGKHRQESLKTDANVSNKENLSSKNKISSLKDTSQEELYTAFKMLLLEED